MANFNRIAVDCIFFPLAITSDRMKLKNWNAKKITYAADQKIFCQFMKHIAAVIHRKDPSLTF